MNSIYFYTKFHTEEEIEEWPEAFAIITAYATTGEKWSDQMNKTADEALKTTLICKSPWIKRITGYSPETGHAEPGWASGITWDQACDLGLEFKQDAIYYVSKKTLSVSYCDERRKAIQVDKFLNRTSIHSDGKGG